MFTGLLRHTVDVRRRVPVLELGLPTYTELGQPITELASLGEVRCRIQPLTAKHPAAAPRRFHGRSLLLWDKEISVNLCALRASVVKWTSQPTCHDYSCDVFLDMHSIAPPADVRSRRRGDT